jgi:hypothetical protein
MNWIQIKADISAFWALCKNPDFNFVSQTAHIGWGFIFVTTPVLLFHLPLFMPAFGTVLLTGIKEYSDAHGGETPAVAGNSWEDFGFWCVGVLLAVMVLR